LVRKRAYSTSSPPLNSNTHLVKSVRRLSANASTDASPRGNGRAGSRPLTHPITPVRSPALLTATAPRPAPLSPSTGAACQLDGWGHTGVAVGEEYWDFGPQGEATKENALSGGVPGGPYWDEQLGGPDKDATRTEIEDAIKNPRNAGKFNARVWEYKLSVCAPQCSVIKKWWQDNYAKRPNYNPGGLQCTTAVCTSLRAAGLHAYFDYASYPSTVKWNLDHSYKNTCGPNRGMPATKTLLYDPGSTSAP
jgi:hypothetical protein